jgi:hypothetical protein
MSALQWFDTPQAAQSALTSDYEAKGWTTLEYSDGFALEPPAGSGGRRRGYVIVYSINRDRYRCQRL